MTQPSPTFLDRIRSLFGGSTDGRLPSSVNAAQALQLVADGAALVDVREAAEWRSGHAPQAVHVPLADLATKTPRRLRKDQQVLVVCASGMRSRAGAKQLRSLGFDAASISGGMAAWRAAGGAVR